MSISPVQAVPVLATSDDARSFFLEALEGNPRFHPVFIDSWEALAASCLKTGFCVVAVDRLGDESLRPHLQRLQVSCPGVQTVIALSKFSEASRARRDILSARVSICQSAGVIPRLLTQTSFDVRERALRLRVSGAYAIPPALRGTLWRYIKLGPEGAVGGYGPIAKALGLSPRTVRRQAAHIGLDLRVVKNSWLCVCLAKSRKFEGADWEALRRRVGYRWLSGVSALYRRTFNMTLHEVDARPAELLLVRFEEEVLTPVWVCEQRAETG